MSESKPTLNDIKQTAESLGIAFDSGEAWFDLDTRPDAQFGLHGTYQNSNAGIEHAYGDLIRHQMTQEKRQL